MTKAQKSSKVAGITRLAGARMRRVDGEELHVAFGAEDAHAARGRSHATDLAVERNRNAAAHDEATARRRVSEHERARASNFPSQWL